MVRDLEMTHSIDTKSECPWLDSSFSSAQSATPSPSSSLIHRRVSMTPSITPSNPWAQNSSDQSSVTSLLSPAQTSVMFEDPVPQIDHCMPQDGYMCEDMLDAMAFLGQSFDFQEGPHGLIHSDTTKDNFELEYAGPQLTPWETSLHPSVSTGLGFHGLPDVQPMATCNFSSSPQFFDTIEPGPGIPKSLESSLSSPSFSEDLPQTVVPSQTITRPITPSSGRSQLFQEALKLERSSSPTESMIVEYSPSMRPSTPDSLFERSPTRRFRQTLQSGITKSCRVPSGPTPIPPPRPSKKKLGSPKKSLDERLPLLVPKQNTFLCRFVQCMKDGKLRGFTRQEHLKRHNKCVHAEERPFECRFCPHVSARNDNLKQHLKTHMKKGNRNLFYPEAHLQLEENKRYEKRKPRRSKL